MGNRSAEATRRSSRQNMAKGKAHEMVFGTTSSAATFQSNDRVTDRDHGNILVRQRQRCSGALLGEVIRISPCLSRANSQSQFETKLSPRPVRVSRNQNRSGNGGVLIHLQGSPTSYVAGLKKGRGKRAGNCWRGCSRNTRRSQRQTSRRDDRRLLCRD